MLFIKISYRNQEIVYIFQLSDRHLISRLNSKLQELTCVHSVTSLLVPWIYKKNHEMSR